MDLLYHPNSGQSQKAHCWNLDQTYCLIATTAIGTILNGLGDVYNHDGILDAKYELTTFWAPILLLHLGGTDTITAYSLEDNELRRRHLLLRASQ